jgi:phosphatidylserine/phosphatidylglycerophosphate/cardiolipin synthase-like enzyme
VFRRVFVLDRTALPSVGLVRPLAPDAPVEVVGEELTAAATPEGMEGWEGLERWSPPGRGPLDAVQLATVLGLKRDDLVVVGPLLRHSARTRAELVVRLAIQHSPFVLSVGKRCPEPRGAASHVAFVSEGDAVDLAVLASTLARFEQAARVSGFLVGSTRRRRLALEATLKAARPERLVAVVGLTAPRISQAQAIDRAAVVRGFFAADALQQAERPMLILPRTTRAPALLADRLAASDTLLLSGAPAWIAVERDGPLGRAQLAPAERIRWGERILDHALGVVALPTDGMQEARVSVVGTPEDSCLLRTLSPTKPLLLVDARSAAEVLAPLERLASDSHVVFVRLRWDDALDALRKRLTERAPWAGVPTVIDASAWLGDGGASDLPEEVDPLRLQRLAARLRSRGARIHSVVGGAVALALQGSEDCSAQDISAERVEGNEILFEVENQAAREALLEAIAGARTSIHWQCYIVEEGTVAARFAAALEEAAGRGVKVRLLIDALYSGHDVFRARNPVLAKLDAIEGIEVCAYRPVTGLPDLVALKQRNHRKLLVIDDAWAVVSGRNLGTPYYTGFGEVALTRASSYREVPWLDCGVQVRGPIVARVQRAFRASWIAAGGTPFQAGAVPLPAGTTPCRLVLHDGLRDTHTFDTLLDLVRRARERVVAVNGFPLAVELQQALVDAVRRGVRVDVLFGCVRPKWGADQPFPGGVIRELADQLIRARLDPVVRAGGQVGELAMELLPGWEPELGRVFPFVHAKILVRDGEEAAVGSANFDVTSAYWESEALLVVDEPVTVRLLLAQLEPLLALARNANRADERWQHQAEQRARLDRMWPSLVG